MRPDSTGLGRPHRAARTLFASACLVAVALLAVASPAGAQQGDAQAGKAVYEKKCALCHGEKGDGKEPAADLLDPRPRDFTAGIY